MSLAPTVGEVPDVARQEWLIGHYKAENTHLKFQVEELRRRLRRRGVWLSVVLTLLALTSATLLGLLYHGSPAAFAAALARIVPPHAAGQ